MRRAGAGSRLTRGGAHRYKSRVPRVARRFLPVLIALLAMPAAASADTLRVTTKADVVPGSLRATIATANPNDVIEVPAGTYKLIAGELVTNKNLTIEGAGAGKTIVDGQGASRVFRLTDATFTLRGLTITGGHDPAMGGGIYTTAAALTLDRVSVRGNAAGGNDVVANGGGIYSDEQLSNRQPLRRRRARGRCDGRRHLRHRNVRRTSSAVARPHQPQSQHRRRAGRSGQRRGHRDAVRHDAHGRLDAHGH